MKEWLATMLLPVGGVVFILALITAPLYTPGQGDIVGMLMGIVVIAFFYLLYCVGTS